MTSPPLTDQKLREDPVEALRVLVADLRALAARLELKEHTPGLQATLKAAQERVSGPRAVVMLLGEHAELKRRFLERLLGPIALVPDPTTECTRLEYGPEPECTVTTPDGLTAVLPLDQLESFLSPQPLIGPAAVDNADTMKETPRQAMRAIRLPNPTLKGGLAVIDTPVVESGEPAASMLACAEQADAWIFVLDADHAFSEASQTLLRCLPERGARLEIVVENAEGLNGEERMAARERLTQTLRERCNIEAPRLTLVASAGTEGDESSFWHGRFATFHSVMMRRGREHWLEGTRAMVLDALTKLGAEIDFELKSLELGLRHARLRLGMKDLEGLRTRFYELGGLGGARPADTRKAEAEPETALPHLSQLDNMWSGGGGPNVKADAEAGQSPLTMLAEAIAALTPESADAEAKQPEDPPDEIPENISDALAAGMGAIAAEPLATPDTALDTQPAKTAAEPPAPPAGLAQPAFVRMSGPAARVRKRGVSVHLSEDLRRLIPHSDPAESGRIRLLKRIAGIALLIAFVCLILWALAPKGFLFGREPAAEWDYNQPKPALASQIVPAATGDNDLPQPGNDNALLNTAGTPTPDISGTPLAKPSGAVRMPLTRPIPSGAIAGVPPPAKRHHHHLHLLGMGKLWHWVRHPHHSKDEQNNQ